MHESVYARAVEDAREAAAQLRHKLGKFDVIKTAAYSSCTLCAAGVSVLFHSGCKTLGAAVSMPCQHGEANTAPPTKPAPPTGKAKRLPTRAPTPIGDDVPWPVEAPIRDAVVLR